MSSASEEESKRSEVVLRSAEPDDSARATAVRWSVGWAKAPHRHRVWPEADADWQTRHYYREIIAEVEGVLAARVGLEAYRQPFAELIDLSVRPDYRRRGLGEQLTKACQQAAAHRGFNFLFLQTEIDNYAAHHLYTSLDFVPTAHGKMLRMLKFLDYPLLAEFRRTHPLSQYSCTPVPDRDRAWNLEWNAYVTQDCLRLCLEGGASQSDSDGIGPALTAFDWRVEEGARGLAVQITSEDVRDLEPGHHVELTITAHNYGKRLESGVFQMVLPPGVHVSSPATNAEQAFLWEVAPGEAVTQPLVVQIEPTFDSSGLWYLNYGSLPVCVETYWEGHRALLSTSLHLAVPPPKE